MSTGFCLSSTYKENVTCTVFLPTKKKSVTLQGEGRVVRRRSVANEDPVPRLEHETHLSGPSPIQANIGYSMYKQNAEKKRRPKMYTAFGAQRFFSVRTTYLQINKRRGKTKRGSRKCITRFALTGRFKRTL